MCEPTNHLHGRLGVFKGGEWIPMAKAPQEWNRDIEDMAGSCKDMDRVKALPEDEYDVIIVGAGCVGASVARELSKFAVKVLVLEKADDVTQGATKGNSGIVHAGYDDEPGSVRAKFCPTGNRMFPALDRDLKFGFHANGSLVVARGKQDDAMLKDLLARGRTNGVEGLRILDQAELRRVEPNIGPDATGALFAPSAGVVIPFEFTIALAENAAMNGVDFKCSREVTAIDPKTNEEDEGGNGGENGSGKYVVKASYYPSAVAQAQQRQRGAWLAKLWSLKGSAIVAVIASVGVVVWQTTASASVAIGVIVAALMFYGEMFLAESPKGKLVKGKVVEDEVYKARYVVNCAGLFSDKVAAMVGDDSFTIKPRIGEYVLMKRPAITNKEEPPLCRHIVFPCPGPMGKGILVQPTLWGNLCLGPTAHDFKDKERRHSVHDQEARGESKDSIMAHIMEECRKLIPCFDPAEIIHSFAGVRAKNSTGDWVVRPAKGQPSFVHAAGVDSPGLAGSPAVALEVVRMLSNAGLPLQKNPHFNPTRKPYIIPKGNWKMVNKAGEEVTIKKDMADDPSRNVICRCELVTEAEVLDAVRRGKAKNALVQVENTQQVRKRTRAGMGWCQGQYCAPKVKAIIAQELGVPLHTIQGRPWPESSLLEKPHQYADSKQ